MDLERDLIESSKKSRKGKRGGFSASAISVALHGALIATIIAVGAHSTNRVDAEDKPIRAFVTQGAAPPPPPPPPPPPAASSSAPKASVPHVQPKPVQIPKNAFVPPTQIPKEVPKVVTPVAEVPQTNEPVSEEPMTSAATDDAGTTDAPGAVVGGVAGGVEGGTVGGELGGVKGGEIGGVKGGEVGGVQGGTVGGTLGGTGTGTEGQGSGGVEAPTGPVRVGGDVKAPVATSRVDPEYTEGARKARISGIVVVEAIIDRNGNVDSVKIVKGLPAGLGEQAVAAVRQWKFKPGTLNGQPVAVIFNLTVNFKLDS